LTLSQNSTTPNDTLGGKLINQEYNYLFQEFWRNEKTLSTTTLPNVNEYTLPSDFGHMIDLTVSVGSYNYQASRCASKQDWDILNITPISNDFVSHYFIWGNTYQIYPIPSSSNPMKVNYESSAQPLVNGSDVPNFNPDFHDMLVYKALVVYFSTIVPDAEKAAAFQDIYDRKFALLVKRKTPNTNPNFSFHKVETVNPNLFINATIS
jgi:hypothetical protein